MSKGQRGYISYLLRLWQIRSAGELVWRASLESSHTGERKGFASLADLFTFLEQEISRAARGQAASNVDEKGGDDHK
ncbi:MAG: hypothetical protein B6I35_02450 [Anaerolineaceae bacterium 4572_32.2]|nr:MAG: hypothetical protein B6I35_02450 [Anaerolineaceae bacterium 4572_32.2]RLC74682.1 MAG: hypothetical protein DRI81_13390 [Chloroflexota bacterium]HEY73505.1 hypothetical protein [Thermoflexia bacterium]